MKFPWPAWHLASMGTSSNRVVQQRPPFPTQTSTRGWGRVAEGALVGNLHPCLGPAPVHLLVRARLPELPRWLLGRDAACANPEEEFRACKHARTGAQKGVTLNMARRRASLGVRGEVRAPSRLGSDPERAQPSRERVALNFEGISPSDRENAD